MTPSTCSPPTPITPNARTLHRTVILLLSRKDLETRSKTELGFKLRSDKTPLWFADVNAYPLDNKHITTHCIGLRTWNKDNSGGWMEKI